MLWLIPVAGLAAFLIKKMQEDSGEVIEEVIEQTPVIEAAQPTVLMSQNLPMPMMIEPTAQRAASVIDKAPQQFIMAGKIAQANRLSPRINKAVINPRAQSAMSVVRSRLVK